jgi:hypothetical protein
LVEGGPWRFKARAKNFGRPWKRALKTLALAKFMAADRVRAVGIIIDAWGIALALQVPLNYIGPDYRGSRSTIFVDHDVTPDRTVHDIGDYASWRRAGILAD